MIKVKWEYLSIDQDKDLINTLGVDKFSTLKENEDIAMVELEDNTIVVYEIIPAKAIRLKYASAETTRSVPRTRGHHLRCCLDLR
jgi:6-phosphofructokinase